MKANAFTGVWPIKNIKIKIYILRDIDIGCRRYTLRLINMHEITVQSIGYQTHINYRCESGDVITFPNINPNMDAVVSHC